MDGQGDGAWFAAKGVGYGAGRPIAWQGWALLGGYLGTAIGSVIAAPLWSPIVVVPATVGLVAVARRRTRGGWRWRTGGVGERQGDG